MRKLIHVFVLLLVILSPGMALILAPVSGLDPLKEDTDGDGIPDGWEDTHGLNPNDATDASLDYNHNGRTNLQEYQNGSDPWDKDTDKDEISNYAECFALFGFYTDPFASDTDGDGISDLTEICKYINTGDETQMKELYTNETDRLAVMVNITNLSRTYPYKLDPTNSDVDGDGLNDGAEISAGTNPNRVDSDYDGLSDGDEVNEYKTDPMKRDTDGDGLLDSEEIFGTHGVVTDATKWDMDGDGISDGEEILGFGFAPIAPSNRSLTYEQFISGAYGNESITLKAKVGTIRYNPNQNYYLIFLNPLESGNTTEGKRGVASVNSSWHYDFEHGEMNMRIDSRFGLSLRGGDTIVIVGTAGNFLGNTREIEVGSEGKIYLVLSPEEASERWLPSRGYVKIIAEQGVTTVTPSPTPTSTPTPGSSPTPASTSTPSPSPSSVNDTNATNETATGEPGAEGKGIFGLLGYVVIVIVIVVASLFLYAKFGKGRPSRKERKEGEGGKPSAEVSNMQKGGRKEWG